MCFADKSLNLGAFTRFSCVCVYLLLLAVVAGVSVQFNWNCAKYMVIPLRILCAITFVHYIYINITKARQFRAQLDEMAEIRAPPCNTKPQPPEIHTTPDLTRWFFGGGDAEEWMAA